MKSRRWLSITDLSEHLQNTLDTYPEAVIADHRYGYIRSIVKKGVIAFQQDQREHFVSDKIDKVLTHRFLGPVIMIVTLMGLYHFTFTYSEIPVNWLDAFFGWFGGAGDAHLPDGLIKSLFISGIIDGVGGVLGFVPLIMFMFFGISIPEDSGYLARVAFVLAALVFQVGTAMGLLGG